VTEDWGQSNPRLASKKKQGLLQVGSTKEHWNIEAGEGLFVVEARIMYLSITIEGVEGGTKRIAKGRKKNVRKLDWM